MRLLLLATIASVIGATTSYAHGSDVHLKSVNQVIPDSLSADSMQMIYDQIDLLSVFDLKKMHESFVYRNRTHPCYLNKQVLFYIEERLKIVK
jgi:hypothetical protein